METKLAISTQTSAIFAEEIIMTLLFEKMQFLAKKNA
jgi:hypothetical protein